MGARVEFLWEFGLAAERASLAFELKFDAGLTHRKSFPFILHFLHSAFHESGFHLRHGRSKVF